MALVQGLDLDRQSHPSSGRPDGWSSAQRADLSTSQPEESFEVPVHGSCSRCHHLHTNKAVQLPLDRQKHTRIKCDHCEHPILGIGRTSTQTTLASVETVGATSRSQSTEVDPGSAPQQQSGNIPTLPAPLRVNTSLNSGDLSTIAEGNSPAQHSSAAVISSSSDGLILERSALHEQITNSEVREDQRRESRQHGDTKARGPAPAKAPSPSPGTSLAGTRKRSFRDRISTHFRKTRRFTFHRLGMSIEVSPTAKTLSPHPAQEFNHEDRNPPLSAHDTPHSMTQISNRSSTSGGQSVLTPPAELSQAPGSGRPDRLIGRTPTQRDKDERIRVRRREATLKRKAETVARCECRSECQCRNGSVRSNAASCGPGDSDRNIQVPDHVLRNLLIDGSGSSASRSSSGVATGSGLAGVGVHFEDEHHDMDDPTNGRLGARQSFDDRLSQASTAYVRSNGSSISLVSRRPSTLRRSNTAPGLSARRPPHVFRPGVSEALQNRYIPDQVHGTAAGPGSSTNGESDAGEVSTMALDGGAEVPDDVGTGEG